MKATKVYALALSLSLTLVACTQPSSAPSQVDIPLGAPSSGPLLSTQSVKLNAGGAAITLNVGSVPSGQTVAWSLTPAGVGTLVGSGSSATYTPPATLAQTVNVTITARLSGGAAGSLVLTLLPNVQTPAPAPTPSPAPTPAPSSDQTAMLAAINAVRAQARNCGTTAYPAVPALKWNAKLEQAALLHSQDMAANNYFSHDSQDGRKPWDRMAAQGYSFGAAAENIAAGQPDLASVMDSWVKSPGHCVNLMSAAYSEVGMAKAENASSTYKIYWTQDFASPR